MYEIVMAIFTCFKHFIILFIIIYDKPSFRVCYQVRNVPVGDVFNKITSI